ncbi:ABC transporter permease [Conexibacter arvalis]|uniref:Putative ABC transport system permease protein n=1 Tax=Conexibacter arvalis TaxID=912552 RepID=A0A840IE07_9ACTN|nr:ABC transporter permease [Conexibacter arvalis]MBB4662258.1 putative ABC transport system permease protein [Conexibacter arvalis]
MRRIALNGLWAHKRRLAGTFLSVFLGVAFLAGTLMLGDTLQRNFERLFGEVTAGTDAVVRSTTRIDDDAGPGQRAPIPASTLARVRAVDGVAAAEPSIEGRGTLIGADGRAVGRDGPPKLAGNWIADPRLNPYRLAEGRAPRTGDEVVVNRGAADDGGLRVGDEATVRTPEPVRVRIVGIATFGSSSGVGATTFTAFSTAGAARHVMKRPDAISSVVVRGEPGLSQAELVARLRPALGSGIEAIAGDRLAAERVDDIDQTFLDGLRTVLVAFAGLALLVGAFTIHNTFAIVAAQRARESALLRAVGATRRQVLGAALTETALLAAVASLAGLVGGIAIASALKAMFDAFGFALPAGGLEVSATSALIAVAAGVVVTLLAGLAPALAASRVPPLAALRDAALEGEEGGASVRQRRSLTALARGARAGGARAGGARAGRSRRRRPLTALVRGATALIAAPLPRLRGTVGTLARRNAIRSPRRTARAASALVVGVTVVTAITVVGFSLQRSLDDSAARSFDGDLAVTGGEFEDASLPPALARELAALPQVATAVGLGSGSARVDGRNGVYANADAAALSRLVDLDLRAGSLDALGRGALAVSADEAEQRGWRVGSPVAVVYPDGARATLRVGAVYGEEGIAGDVLLPRAAWERHAPQSADRTIFVSLAPGVGEAAGKAAVERVAERWGAPETQTRQEYVDAAGDGVRMVLSIVYVLLALAVVIALLGIANTLALATHERTRELGLLRAVGQTRGQLRATVRWEAVVIALLGTTGGIVLGLPIAFLLTRLGDAVGIETFAVPVAQLAIVLVVGGLAGVLAGVRPARRAARLDVLRAIAAE